MPTPSSSSSSSSSRAPEPTSDSALESRLFKRLESFMTEIRDALRSQKAEIDKQGEKIDRLTEDRVNRDEYDALRRRVDTQATEVAVQGQRLQALEAEQTAEGTSRRQRPIQTWQIVLAAVAVLTSLFFDFITATIAVVNMVILLKK